MTQKKQQKWFVGDTDSHTNGAIQIELSNRAEWYATERRLPVTDRQGPQPVIELPWEFIKWLRDNKTDQHFRFRILREPAPDCTLVPFVLQQMKRGAAQAKRAQFLKRIKQKQA